LLVVFTTLLAILSDSFFGLIFSWSGMTISWFVFLWVATRTASRTRQFLLNGSALMLAIVLLAITGVAGLDASNIAENSSGLPSSALIWGTLSGLTILIGLPMVLLYPPPERNFIQFDSMVPAVLLSSIAGGFFLARIASFGFSSTLFLLIMTGLGLIGLLLAVYLALVRFSDRTQAVPLLLMAGVCNVLLMTLWGDPTAVVAQIGILSIGIGAFFFIEEYGVINKWAAFIPVSVVAGMPFTLGFTGLTGLYLGWLDLDMYPLLLVTALLNSLFIADVILVVRSVEARPMQEKPQSQRRYTTLVALILICLGLIDLPNLDIEGAHIFVWITILLSTATGISMAWYIESRKVAVDELRGFFRLKLPGFLSHSKLNGIYSSYKMVMKEIVAILEGEGGMLWVLVLIIILWFARQR